LVRLELRVEHGAAEQPLYAFTAFPVAIGRGANVRDARHQLIRSNHVVFVEGGGEANGTVSRRHARIEHDRTTPGLRLHDDGSAQGTSVVRRGRGFAVPAGARGMRLESGDEIVLGRARLAVEIAIAPTPATTPATPSTPASANATATEPDDAR
jgi:hypothetical protein